MTEASQSLIVEPRGAVLIVTINRPQVKNAVDPKTSRAIQEAMDLLDDTDELFVGIITGAGGNFSTGADLRVAQRQMEAGEPREQFRRGGFGLFRRPPRKPLIAAVEGYAVGGGLELALACDLIVAAETARFGLPEVRHNVIAVGGGLFRLPRRIPYHMAMEMALTGTFRDAVALERWGMINRVTEEGGALHAAEALAETLLANGPTALAACKEIIFQANSWPTEAEAWENQLPIAQVALDSADREEGLSAFAEKRKPVWKGR